MSKPNDVINIIATTSHTGSAKTLMGNIRTWRDAGIQQWTGSVGSPLKVNYVHVGTNFPYSGSIISKDHPEPSHIFQVQVGDGRDGKVVFVKNTYSPLGQESDRNTISSSLKTKRGTTQNHTAGGETDPGDPSG